MKLLFFFIFFFIAFLLAIVLGVVGFIRSIFSPLRETQRQASHRGDTSYSSSQQRAQQQQTTASTHSKVFTDEEGEYVDFEEIKE